MKLFRIILCVTFLLGASSSLEAAQGRVIQISRALSMSAEQGKMPRDVFINLGSKDGVKKGEAFRVLRAVPVINELNGKLRELMSVELGFIKVISVSQYTSIGRVTVENTPREMPNIDYPVIMVGDRIEPIKPKAQKGNRLE